MSKKTSMTFIIFCILQVVIKIPFKTPLLYHSPFSLVFCPAILSTSPPCLCSKHQHIFSNFTNDVWTTLILYAVQSQYKEEIYTDVDYYTSFYLKPHSKASQQNNRIQLVQSRVGQPKIRPQMKKVAKNMKL